ncbi:MAG TPA: Ppx/GppA phosphatase family protein [Gaiella sp.]|nr:Ppx/GppA phosphatase family protein [Gaiella sp.]
MGRRRITGRPLVVPRWEWRTFGDAFDDAEPRLGALAPTKVQDSDELYILSNRVEGSIKVRDGRLDVKLLEEVDDDGLEQWRPVATAEFGVRANEVASLLEALDASVPFLARETYDLRQLVEDVVAPHDDLRAVPVRKHRVHHRVDGCMAELTDVRSGSHATRTLAVESEDPVVVRATVEALGLWSRPNVNFPRGLALLVGFGARGGAVLDVGTNSVKLLVALRAADGAWRPVVDRAEVTRLGEGLATSGRLAPAAMRRTVDAIPRMVDEARAHEVGRVVAVGTAWMRRAENADELVAAVRERAGVRITPIDGEDEARLSYLAALSGLGSIEANDGPVVVFETGGGSTQFTFGHGERIDERFSVEVGAVRITERFGLARAVDQKTLAAASSAVAGDLARLDGRPAPDLLVGMGGALTNIAAVKLELSTYDSAVVQGTVIDREELDRQIEVYRTMGAEERRSIVGLQEKRADIILAGACIVRTVLEKLESTSVVVSDRGLRHRVLVERFGA